MSSSRIKTFDRFKYAEEFAHRLDQEGDRSWKMYRTKDTEYEEDGETYTHPTYVVTWVER